MAENDFGNEERTMQTITLMNQKGGAGKSTLARALLGAGDTRGLRLAFIDADQTGNLARWAMRASKGGCWSPGIDAYQTIASGEIEDIVDEIEAEGQVDLLVIDTAGDASRDHDVFAIVADLILCPILLSQSDLETARGTANYLYRMRSRADDPSLLPEFRIVLNRLPSRPSAGDAALIRVINATALVGADLDHPVEQLKILPATIQEREAYRVMDRAGLLGRVLARHNEAAPAFSKDPKHMLNAMTEADALLTTCLSVNKESPA
jgi:chromosome partitioning protein